MPVLAFSPDGLLAVAGAGSSKGGSPVIRLLNAADGLKAMPSIVTTVGSIDALGFSTDGKRLTGGASQDWILLFDASTGQEQGNMSTSSWMGVDSIVFSPDNKIIASGRSR